jgi:hypothetical protein
MVEKAFLVEPQRKAVMLVCHPRIMVVIGLGAFLLFIGETGRNRTGITLG